MKIRNTANIQKQRKMNVSQQFDENDKRFQLNWKHAEKDKKILYLSYDEKKSQSEMQTKEEQNYDKMDAQLE